MCVCVCVCVCACACACACVCVSLSLCACVRACACVCSTRLLENSVRCERAFSPPGRARAFAEALMAVPVISVAISVALSAASTVPDMPRCPR